MFDQPYLVIANLLAHCVLKIGNNWLYKGYWHGKVFRKIFEKKIFSGLPTEIFFRCPVCRKQVYIIFVALLVSISLDGLNVKKYQLISVRIG